MKLTIHFCLATLSVVAISIIVAIVFDCGIPCRLTPMQISQVNNVYLSLSTSALCSILFYYILVYYPEKQRTKVMQPSINRNLETIVNEMNWLFAVISKTYDCTTDEAHDEFYSNLNLDKFPSYALSINVNPGEKITYGRFECRHLRMPNRETDFVYERVLPIDLHNHKNIVLHNIEVILPFLSISALNTELIKSLYNLRKSLFLTQIIAAYSKKQTDKDYVLLGLSEYYEIYIGLLAHIKPSIVYELIELDVAHLDSDLF